MKKLFQFLPFLFVTKEELKEQNININKDYMETVVQTEEGDFLLTTEIKSLTVNGNMVRERILMTCSKRKDYNLFIAEHGLFNEANKIYLN